MDRSEKGGVVVGGFLNYVLAHFCFLLYGSWEALDSLKTLPRGTPTFSTPGEAIPRRFENRKCWLHGEFIYIPQTKLALGVLTCLIVIRFVDQDLDKDIAGARRSVVALNPLDLPRLA